MSPCRGLILCLAFAGRVPPAAAQNASEEFHPELGIYFQEGDSIRIEFIDSVNGGVGVPNWQGNFGYYLDAALKPVLRRNLRENPDVYRNRYLSMRAGYHYQTSITSAGHNTAKIGIVELTSRYMFPGQVAASDRNRGEFRFMQGQALSTRYRNRFRLERDLRRGRFACTPYVDDEVFYDTRFDALTTNRFTAGVQIPAGRHLVLEPYYSRQHSPHANPRNFNLFGFKWNLFF